MGGSDGEGQHDRLLWSAVRKARTAGEHVFPSLVRALRQAAGMDERQAGRAAFEFVRRNPSADPVEVRTHTRVLKMVALVSLGVAALFTLYAFQIGRVWARALVAPYLWIVVARALISAYWTKWDPRRRLIEAYLVGCLYAACAVWLFLSPEAVVRRLGLVWLALAAVTFALTIRRQRRS